MISNPLRISYSDWKIAAQGKPAWLKFHVVRAQENAVIAITGNLDYVFVCDVSPDDYTDWSTSFSGSQLVESVDGAVARIIGLSKTPEPAPTTADYKPIVTPYPAREGFNSWVTSSADKLTATKARGTGNRIHLEWNIFEAGDGGTSPNKSVDMQFLEPTEFHDGQALFGPTSAVWNGGNDYFSLAVILGATVGTDVSGQGDGNAHKVATGLGYNAYIPAAGDGNWELDLGDGTPLDLGTVVPLCDEDKIDGYWDTDYFTGIVTPAPNGDGNTDLIDIAAPSPTFVNDVYIGAETRSWDVDPAKSEWCHPSWPIRLTAHKGTSGAGWFNGWFFIYREKTWSNYP